ncbi:MAG: EamA family transporter [Phycisphaerae bacterium]|nr:EamA family transporter [Saprospiraceae bacterium]
MLFLLLTVACSVLLGFIFKLFARFGVDGFQAIVFNYFTCFCCGWIHLGHFPVQAENFGTPWMPYALVLGLVFVSGFNVAALTVRYFGVTVGQIMQKMSILMTVPFAILVYHESAGWVKILGVLFALVSIVLVNWPSTPALRSGAISPERVAPKRSSGVHKPKNLLWIPIATWVLAGLLEVLLVRVQNEGLADMSDPTFIITIFGTAGVLGLVVAVVGWLTGRLQFSWKNVVAGVILGVPNYGSMLFMLLALSSGLEGSFVFPVANVGIIVATTIGAVTLFRERLSRLNWVGIGLALLGIGLISF